MNTPVLESLKIDSVNIVKLLRTYYDKYLQTAASGLFLSMKTDLLNARGLSGQCSIAYV